MKELFKLEKIYPFYSNPTIIRQSALAQTYTCTNTFNASPGKSINLPVDPSCEGYQKIMNFFIEKNIHVHISNRTLRLATQYDLENARIHVDKYHFHVIVSLTPHHEQMQDFEQIYKYKHHLHETPINFLREQYDEEYSKNISSVTDNLDREYLFECTMKEQFIFNTAMIVNSTYLHYPSNPRFGDTIEEGRLVEIWTIDILSMIPRFLNYKYMWYFENILNEDTIEELRIHIEELSDNHIRDSHNDNVQFQTNHLLEFNDGLFHKCLRTYLFHIMNNMIEMKELFQQLSEKNNINNIALNIYACSYSEYSSVGWSCDMMSKSTFIAFLHLNDNKTGLSIIDHFSNNTAVIPAIKNSLFIIPNSWLYPLRQTRIFEGRKLFLKIYITFHLE